MVQAKPALDEAIALKPSCCNAFALPTSNGLGRMKHPLSCIFLKVARLSAVVTGMSRSLSIGLAALRWGCAQAGASARHAPRGCPLEPARDRPCHSRG